MGPFLVQSQQIASPVRSIRLLLLEEDERDAEEILAELQAGGIAANTRVARSREECEQALGDAEFDAVISAFRLPGWDGLEALQMFRSRGYDLPFLLVTRMLGEEAAVECIKLGADDYVLKDRLARLPFAMKRALADHQLRMETNEVRAALQESETRFRELVENSVYGVFRVSPEGRLLSLNGALLRILACSSQAEAQELNLARDIFRYPDTFANLLSACREQGVVQNAEAEWRRRDGGLISVRLHLRHGMALGKDEMLQGSVEDVTEIRALERQLRQAQKFETIGQMAGGIAHDFNNVLGAVLGWAELGYDQSRELPSIAEYFTHIRQQAERAAGLTRELLAFARKQPLQPRALDLNKVVLGLMSLLEKVIGKDIEIKIGAAKELGSVKADPSQIEQVLMNLCINARDAMPDGGVLQIQTEMMELDDSFCHFYPGVEAGTYAVLTVGDTGIGMTNEVREHIFEPFFTTKEKGKGSGMGLATVYGIVRQHGGFIHVYSELGHGTLFHIYLPAMSNAAPEASAQKQPLQTRNLQGSETILIAEDHDSIREMVRQSLESLGYRVLAAADGQEALRLAGLNKPALAILDLVMPRLGGTATGLQLRTRFPGLPVLFTSGFSENADAAMSQVPGARYLQKPYSPTSLAVTLRDFLDRPGCLV